MAETLKIGGELESTATGNVVAAASAIKDKVKNKYQGEINAETDASLADRYTKAETYNKTELNNMITTPNQQYVSVTANSQTTAVTDVLPATGAANTVYRVGNWDSSQFDASVYSEYAWNGSSYVHLSTKTKIGEVFDISAYHATGGTLATYANLSAALDSNNGGGVPQSLQKGGMSVKFVQSSDNKYVQFRLMSGNFNTTPANWQGVDEELKSESKNLAESGAAFRRCENTDISLNLVLEEEKKSIAVGTIYNGNLVTSYDCLTNNNFIEVLASRNYGLKHASDITLRITEYDVDKQYIRNSGSYKAIENIALSETTKYIKISANYNARGFNQSNPITVDDYQNGDFAVLLPVARNLIKPSEMEARVNGVKASSTCVTKSFSVTSGSHSSNNDAVDCFIEAGRKVGIRLNNVTTSNKGAAVIYVWYEGESSSTALSAHVSFNSISYTIFDRNVVKISLYWPSTVGTTDGIVEYQVFYASSINKKLNTTAYLDSGADFEWTETSPCTIKLGSGLIIKHAGGNDFSASVSNLLDIASNTDGFSVNRDNNTITFPIVGIMYFDSETRTVAFAGTTDIANDGRYIVLFLTRYTSTKYGLLIDYAMRKKYNGFVEAKNTIDVVNTDFNLVEGVHVVSTTSADAQKYYAVTLKRGTYYVYNYGSEINSFFLCSSITNHNSNREITVGTIKSNSIVQIDCNLDNIVCVDGWWPSNTDFVIYSEEGLHTVYELTKQKRELSYIGNDETIVRNFFPVNKNTTYRIIPDRTTWPVAVNTKSYDAVAFEIMVNGVSIYSRKIAPGASTFTALDSYINVEIPDTYDISCISIGVRALLNEEVTFRVVDITSIAAISASEQSSIFKTNPEEEFIPKIRTLKKRTPYGYSPTNTPLVLLWFSDLHHDLANLERINLWKAKYSSYIDDVLNTGDTLYDNLSSYSNDMNAYFDDYDGTDILLAMGNHDVTTPNSAHKAWDGTQSITDMYAKYIGRLDANALGITQPANAAANGYCYYYKDYVGLGISTSGIRLIVIDSCITDADYQTTQVAWFIDTLAGAKTLGYDVVVASHYMPGGCDEFNNAKGFCYYIQQYRAGQETVDSRYASAIDDFINGGGKFVTWLCGHTHADHVGTVPSHSDQMVIAITTARSNDGTSAYILPVRPVNTKAQDAFDHIEIDTYSKQVKLVRVGYNVDALGREINMITLDYQNKKVVI